MAFDPALLDELARVFAEAAVRELERETAAGARAGQHGGDGADDDEYTARAKQAVR
jgi:hypothetical protein